MTDLSVAGDTPTWTLRDRLRKAREYRGMQQPDLAELTGISLRSIQNYEAGRTTPKRPQLIAWAMATGVALDWLVEDAAVRPKGLEPLTFWTVLCRAQEWVWRCAKCGGELDDDDTCTECGAEWPSTESVRTDGLALAA